MANSLRVALLANVTQMLAFAERELEGTQRAFEYEYEQGFVYHHRSDNINFFYYPSTKTARVQINHYGSSMYVWKNKLTADYEGTKDFTEKWLDGSQCYDSCELQDALMITQRKWNAIKNAIIHHKEEENEVFNFQL